MDNSLIIVVNLIFLLGEVVVFKSDDESVRRFWGCLQFSILGFMYTINKAEFVVPPFDLFPGFWVKSSCVLDIRLP